MTEVTCRAKIKNNSNSKIIKSLVRFTDWDGVVESDPADGRPGSVDIGRGETGYRYARQDRCWRKVWAFVVTNDAGSFDREIDTPVDYCRYEANFELNRTNIAKSTKDVTLYFDADQSRDVRVESELSDQGREVLESLK